MLETIIYVLINAFLGGIKPLLSKTIVRETNPLDMSLLRCIIGGILCFVILLIFIALLQSPREVVKTKRFLNKSLLHAEGKQMLMSRLWLGCQRERNSEKHSLFRETVQNAVCGLFVQFLVARFASRSG